MPRTVLRKQDFATEATQKTDPVPDDGVLRWKFETPVHLTGKIARGEAPFRPLDLILAGRRRWHLMTSLFGEVDPKKPERLDNADFQVVSRSLKPWSIARFSGRQKRSVPLFGSIGHVDIKGPWSRAGNWIQVIRHLHLGKHVSFGFGRVTWTQVD
ncbi:CRISPR system precrRNA processing endoribonuclease RAMP protein Cas6 [Phycisphaerales bacterium]|nr:CRISPR system precrRNA processing endoribonuclease RAMP protein Cas6 [Phycisphaerales bacterium]